MRLDLKEIPAGLVMPVVESDEERIAREGRELEEEVKANE